MKQSFMLIIDLADKAAKYPKYIQVSKCIQESIQVISPRAGDQVCLIAFLQALI